MPQRNSSAVVYVFRRKFGQGRLRCAAFCPHADIEVFRRHLVNGKEQYVGVVELPQFTNLCFFANAYDRQTFEDLVVARCTRLEKGGEGEKDDEVVDLDKLLAFLRDLEIRGNLQVQRPSTVAGLAQLLSQYDGGGDGVKKMQMREWRVFLQDVATDPVDHTTSSVAKLAREVHNLHATARAERRCVLAMHEQLRSLIKAKAVRRRSSS